MEEKKENPAGNEAATYCQLEKSYEIALEHGTTVQIHMAMSVSGYVPENLEKILSEFAKRTHGFYLEAGTKLNNTL